ncbi:hypothetical protein G6F32_017040 [Rhizopus arrhizus]|nr:hypothetical protein G6F32_017040 [Rhizopus arrhizus]
MRSAQRAASIGSTSIAAVPPAAPRSRSRWPPAAAGHRGTPAARTVRGPAAVSDAPVRCRRTPRPTAAAPAAPSARAGHAARIRPATAGPGAAPPASG